MAPNQPTDNLPHQDQPQSTQEQPRSIVNDAGDLNCPIKRARTALFMIIRWA